MQSILNNIYINTHSSIKIDGDKIIYFDPYKIENEFYDADFIFITHSHYDHLDLNSIKKIINKKTVIIYPKSIANDIKNFKFDNDCIEVEPNNEYLTNNIKIKTIPSYNINKDFHKKEMNWVGYLTEINNIKYFIPGDTDVINEIKKIKTDILFLPIGGVYTMDYIEAGELANLIKPKCVIPIHYGSIVGDKELGNKFENLIDKNIICKIYI